MKESSSLGYANNFVEKPPLKTKHKPRGAHHTPPSLKSRLFIQDKLYRCGYRVLNDGQFEIVHVEGKVFPHGQINSFANLKAGVKSFLSLTSEG